VPRSLFYKMKIEISDKQARVIITALDLYAPGPICDLEENGRIAYDLQCVIRADIAERENHPRSSVWHGPPLHTCKSEPLAKVFDVENNKQTT